MLNPYMDAVELRELVIVALAGQWEDTRPWRGQHPPVE